MIKKAKKSNSKISQISTGVLVLENKKIFRGIGIGYQGEATGEVCFNTSLTGYQEIISEQIFLVSSSPSCLGKNAVKISYSFCSISKRSVLLFFL